MIDAKTVDTRIGWLLRIERKQKRWTQTVAAEKIGVQQSMYSRIETGEHAITVAELAQVCGALGVDPLKVLKAVLA